MTKCKWDVWIKPSLKVSQLNKPGEDGDEAVNKLYQELEKVLKKHCPKKWKVELSFKPVLVWRDHVKENNYGFVVSDGRYRIGDRVGTPYGNGVIEMYHDSHGLSYDVRLEDTTLTSIPHDVITPL